MTHTVTEQPISDGSYFVFYVSTLGSVLRHTKINGRMVLEENMRLLPNVRDVKYSGQGDITS